MFDDCYRADGSCIRVPDVQLSGAAPGRRLEGVRGYGYTLIVLEDQPETDGGIPTGASVTRCVGWVDVSDLGFDSARAWAAAQGRA